jgi:hypothetical protein
MTTYMAILKTKKAWKSLQLSENGEIKSKEGNCIWKIGEWKKEENPSCCNKGFHSSNLITDAMSFVGCEVIAEVEYRGKTDSQEDKQSSEEMRILRAWKWKKVDSMKSSIFYVKQSMKYVDKNKFPEVFSVCINSIKTVEDVILNDCDATRSAAWSARSAARSAAESAAESAARSAARSARSARSAAWSARSAESAAESAGSAARSAWSAWSAWSAARSAESAAESAGSAARSAWSAWSAARSAAKKLQHIWLKKYIIKNCERIDK